MLLASSSKNFSNAEELTSGIISGTSSCILKKDELSITIHPAFAALGANSAETFPPGENKPMSTLEKSKSDKSSTTNSSSWNVIFYPLDFEEASKYRVLTGKFFCSKIVIISLPTFPVAPTTAILNFLDT